MSKVVATTVLPEDSGEVLTFGDTGDAIAISGDSLNLNKLQDAGGNNIITSDGAGNLTINSGLGGAMNLLETNTFTGTTTSNFTTLIDSTYDVYKFVFININPDTDKPEFQFQCSTDGGSNYNVTMTTTYFISYHNETDSNSGLDYSTTFDQAQATSYQTLVQDTGNDADSSGNGEIYLFAPSSTIYIKNFFSTANNNNGDEYDNNTFIGGYFNTTSAINAISFKMSSGNMDGIIKMYGISKS